MNIQYRNLDKLLKDTTNNIFKSDIKRFHHLEFVDNQKGYDHYQDGWLKDLENLGMKSKEGILYYTPINIANDMLDLIPQEVWSNPDIKILNICDKSGVFIYLAYIRFMIGLADKIPDVNKRRAHILLFQLYSVAMDEKYAADLAYQLTGFYTKDAFNVLTVGEYYEYEQSIKTERIRKDLMEEFDTMKFDIVVGNPPYNNDLYLDFVTLADSLSSQYTLMITPAKWQAKGGQKNEAFRQNIVPRMSDIVYYPDCSDVFSIGEVGGVCYYIVHKEHKTKCRVTEICYKNDKLNYSDIIHNFSNITLDIVGNSILSKVSSSKRFRLHSEINNKYKIYTNNLAAIGGSKAQGTYLFSKDGKLQMLAKSTITKDSTEENLFSNNFHIIFSSDRLEECQSVYSYIQTRFIRFLLYLGRCGNSMMSSETWRFVPDPGAFDHIFTDKELYKKYNLTQEEISLIESVIKERK